MYFLCRFDFYFWVGVATPKYLARVDGYLVGLAVEVAAVGLTDGAGLFGVVVAVLLLRDPTVAVRVLGCTVGSSTDGGILKAEALYAGCADVLLDVLHEDGTTGTHLGGVEVAIAIDPTSEAELHLTDGNGTAEVALLLEE